MSHWIEGQVVDNKQWTSTLYSLYLQANILPFTAGQFTQLSLQGEAPQKFFRPYSFANAPQEKPLEFYYNVVNGGAFSTKLAALKQGDPIWINEKAAGFFVLADVASSPILWLIATGTGLGVFLSLLKTPEPWQRFEKVVLIHSVHVAQSLTHQTLIQQFQQQYHQQFFYLPIVTREKLGHIVSERITHLYETKELERITALSISAMSSQFMLCGNPAMIHDMVALLESDGLMLNRPRQKGNITLESYWKAKS